MTFFKLSDLASLGDTKVNMTSGTIRNATTQKERRFIGAEELRIVDEEGGDGPKLQGYAAVFNAWTNESFTRNMGFRERIRPGAFAKTIKEADIRAVIDHEPSKIIGRSSAGNLILEEDEVGLRYSVPLDMGVSYVADLARNVKSKNITGNSFGFRTITDNWSTVDGEDSRELIEVQLYDVGPVTFPAYDQTSLALRSLPVEENLAELRGLLFRLESGRELRKKDQKLLDFWVERLRSFKPEEPGPASHSEKEKEPGETHSESRLAEVDRIITTQITDLIIGGHNL